jgi:V8-like Glu-specific endopeptidase
MRKIKDVMTNFKLIFCLVVVMNSIKAFASENVIYGSDDRHEFYEVSALLQKISQSTAAQINSNMIDFSGPDVYLNGLPLFETPILEGGFPLCKNERFSEQMSAARCSGFLISPDTLLTAGHCVMNQSDCQDNFWVFNFKNTVPNQTGLMISKENVYRCKSILKQGLTQAPDGAIDFAVIKLDRPNPVGGLKISKKRMNIHDDVTMLGHPTGMPLKITTNGKIKRISAQGYVTDLDAFGGNSGSLVISSKSGEVIGILSSGQQDYVPDMTNFCARTHRTDSVNASEYVSSIHQIGIINN